MQEKKRKDHSDVIPFMAEICPDKPILDVYAVIDHTREEEQLEQDLSGPDDGEQ